jgi:hypothetical protein
MQDTRTPVAGLDVGDSGANLLNSSDGLVAEDTPVRDGRDVALEDVQVSPADRDSVHAHDGRSTRSERRESPQAG